MTRCTWLKQHLAQAPATYGIKTAFCSVLSTQVKESPNKFQTMIRAVPANINQFGSLYAWRCRNFGCWNPGFIVGHRGVLRHTCRLPLRLIRLVLIILHYANEIFPMKRSLVTTLRNFSATNRMLIMFDYVWFHRYWSRRWASSTNLRCRR